MERSRTAGSSFGGLLDRRERRRDAGSGHIGPMLDMSIGVLAVSLAETGDTGRAGTPTTR
jgi:hypothetical protein